MEEEPHDKILLAVLQGGATSAYEEPNGKPKPVLNKWKKVSAIKNAENLKQRPSQKSFLKKGVTCIDTNFDYLCKLKEILSLIF